MSELPEGVAPAVEPRPRDSAAAIVLRRDPRGGVEVLLGLRSKRSRFMPGHLAFPGGGVEVADHAGGGSAFARCATRELREETGLDVAPERWLPAGARTTPPIFPVRFHTEFHVAELTSETSARPVPGDGENDELTFESARGVIERWERGAVQVPPPVVPILRALCEAGETDVTAVARRVMHANEVEQRSPRIEFVPGIWMLPVRSATLPPATHTNVWLPGGRRFVVVDPGSADPEERARLARVVERRRELGHVPVAVLLTHHHRDHCAGAVTLARGLGLPLRADAGVLAALPGSQAGPAPKFHPLRDGDTIDLEGMTLRVLATPGHAPGHLAFHLPEARALLAGDLVSGLSTILIDPDHGDMGEYLDSLRRARRLDCRVLLPGHGPPLAPRELALALEHREQRAARVLERLVESPAPVEEIARAAYADTPTAPEALARRQTLSHLLALESRGEVVREDPDGRRWRAGGPGSTSARIEAMVRRAFDPIHFELRDDSALHAGHRGASSGGGHYHLTVVSHAFEGCSRLEQHRRVHTALAELFRGRIHALSLTTLTPSEWTA